MSEEITQMESVILDTEVEDVNPSDAGALSFDELDTITDDRSEEQLAEQVQEKITSKENKPEPTPKSDAEKGKETEEEAQEEIKKLIAKYGEDELEIASSALFKHKVDGEEIDVELQELLNNYSGKISYDKKFQELSDHKKQYETDINQYKSEMDEVNTYINNFANKIKENDALGALEYFAQFSGMKPYEFRRELLNQLSPEIDRIKNMTPDQQRVEELDMQNQYLQRQQESVQEQQQNQQTIKELELEIAKVQEAHNISPESFSEAFENLKESDYEGDITPQSVVEFHLNMEAYTRSESILSGIEESLVQNEEVVETLQNIIIENPSFDNDDLLEIVQDVFGNAKKEVSKTVSKKATMPKEQQTKEPRKQEEYVDWEDF